MVEEQPVAGVSLASLHPRPASVLHCLEDNPDDHAQRAVEAIVCCFQPALAPFAELDAEPGLASGSIETPERLQLQVASSVGKRERPQALPGLEQASESGFAYVVVPVDEAVNTKPGLHSLTGPELVATLFDVIRIDERLHELQAARCRRAPARLPLEFRRHLCVLTSTKETTP